jgi:spermidine/putrescine transport system ATP-binding protein
VTLPSANFTAGQPKSGDKVKLCIRPEHFRASAGDATTRFGEANITGSAFFGTHYRCHLAPVAANELSLVAHMPQSARVETGDRIALAVDPAGVTVLPAA